MKIQVQVGSGIFHRFEIREACRALSLAKPSHVSFTLRVRVYDSSPLAHGFGVSPISNCFLVRKMTDARYIRSFVRSHSLLTRASRCLYEFAIIF